MHKNVKEYTNTAMISGGLKCSRLFVLYSYEVLISITHMYYTYNNIKKYFSLKKKKCFSI